MSIFSKDDSNSERRIVIRTGIAVGFILAIFLAIQSVNAIKEFQYIGDDATADATIEVSGSGEVFGVPDTARFRASVIETADTVNEAQQASAERMDRAIERVQSFGVSEEDIKTVEYSVNPRYEYNESACQPGRPCPPEGRRQLVGYEVRQSIEVKVEERDTAGEIVTALGEVGAQEIGNIRMTIDDPDKLQSEARQKAIADAKRKGTQLASDLGVTLGRIVDFRESGEGHRPVMYEAERAMDDAEGGAPAPLPAGEQQITSNVTITYTLK